jgi:uncharacterized protein (DUF4415 family)
MRAKKNAGSTDWKDPDDAPELTDAMLAEAELFEGDRFVRRGPGRPKAAATKEAINVRLDPDVLARLREGGPGWQSRINAILRAALGLEGGQTSFSKIQPRRPPADRHATGKNANSRTLVRAGKPSC